jgi:hypothetical protein
MGHLNSQPASECQTLKTAPSLKPLDGAHRVAKGAVQGPQPQHNRTEYRTVLCCTAHGTLTLHVSYDARKSVLTMPGSEVQRPADSTGLWASILIYGRGPACLDDKGNTQKVLCPAADATLSQAGGSMVHACARQHRTWGRTK